MGIEDPAMAANDVNGLVNLVSEILRIPQTDVIDALDMEETGTWDSLSHMQLIVAIESEYGVELSADDIVTMRSVGNIKNVLRSKGVAV